MELSYCNTSWTCIGQLGLWTVAGWDFIRSYKVTKFSISLSDLDDILTKMTWNIIKLVILPFPYMNSSMRLVFCIVSNYSLVCLLQMKTSTNLFYRTSRLSRHQNSKLFWCSCGRRRYYSPSHLVWRKGSLCVTVLCTIYNGAQRYGSSYRSVNCIGLWSCLVQLSIFQAPLCLWASWCYIDIKICLVTNHRPSVLWHCWFGHMTDLQNDL